MKVDSGMLFKVVRQVVQEEVRKVLPELIKTHLTENYMKRLVQEAAAPRSKKSSSPALAEVLMTPKEEDELDEVPEPLANTDRGIYSQGMPGVHKNNESKKKNPFPENHPLAFVFEGTKPVPGEGDSGDSGLPSIPIEKVGMDFEGMNRLLEGMEKKSSKGEMVTNDMKMRELEAKRKALEVKPR